jgi:hypothetical protein
MPLMNALALAALLPVSLVLAQPSSATGSLQGSVTDPLGVPLVGAQVTYASVPQSVAAGISTWPVPGDTVVNGSVSTGANGAFAVAGLPAAQYSLCANVPSAPYINPCIWGQPVQVTIPAGVTVNQTLALQKGVYLNVTVNDPTGLLPQVIDGPWTPRKLLVGVTYGTGAYQGAVNTAGHSYQLIVPVGTPFWLRLYSTDVALTDATGAALATPVAGISFQASAGQNQAFTFAVSGAVSNAK